LPALNWFNGGMAIENWTPSLLRQAAELKEQIESLEQQLEAVLRGGEIAAAVDTAEETPPVKAKRGRPAKAKKPAEAEAKPRRKISAAGRAAMAAAAKARWAKAKATKAA
jgi:hypothetical protein